MSLEDRIKASRQNSRDQERAEQLEEIERKQTIERERVQKWREFEAQFYTGCTAIENYLQTSNLPNLLNRAKHILHANLKAELIIGGWSPQSEKEWQKTIREEIDGRWTSSVPYLDEVSQFTKKFTLAWNFGKISYAEESWDFVEIEVDVPGTIVFKGSETITDKRSVWVASPMLLEQHLGDIVLDPQSHEVYPYHPPSRT
jgi:hypothetical protein